MPAPCTRSAVTRSERHTQLAADRGLAAGGRELRGCWGRGKRNRREGSRSPAALAGGAMGTGTARGPATVSAGRVTAGGDSHLPCRRASSAAGAAAPRERGCAHPSPRTSLQSDATGKGPRMLGGCSLSPLGDKSSRGKRLCVLLPVPGRAGCRAHGHQDAARGTEGSVGAKSRQPLLPPLRGDKAMPPAPEKPRQGESWERPQDLSINAISTEGSSRGSCLIFSIGWGGLAVLAG